MERKAKRQAAAKKPRTKKVPLNGEVTITPPFPPPLNAHVDTSAVITGALAQPTRMSDIPDRPRDWLWADMLPFGVVTVLTGPLGTGKTSLLNAIAAECTVGGVLPGEDGPSHRSVLWYAIESDPSTEIKPRLRAARANPSRVYLPDYNAEGRLVRVTTMPTDATTMGDLAFRVDAAAVVFDPLTSHLAGGLNPNDPLQVRTVMDTLSRVAAQHNLCIVATMHTRKYKTGEPLSWISGSPAWGQAARQVLLCDHHPDCKGEFLLSVLKGPGQRRGTGWHYRLNDCDGWPVIEWVAQVDVDPREIAELGDLGELRERADALQWMKAELAEQQEPAKLFARWQQQGFSRNLWWRCRRKLGVLVSRTGDHPHQQTWLSLPPS